VPPRDRQDLLALVAPLAKALRRVEDTAAGRHGLSMWQYAILAVVDRWPDRNQSEVATRLDYSKNRIVADLDHLEAEGLLARTRDADRRANRLRITDRGRTVRAAVQRDIHAGEDELLAALPVGRRRDVERVLLDVAGAVRTPR
jgi:DNA-binding MarR family transcriptional regulator